MRLLVVEDDRSLAAVLERGLVEDGYAVDRVGSVVDARHHAQSHDYDLVVLDRGLPDGDGVSLCREWRDDGSSTPVLMLTARDGLTDKVEGLDAGADDYLTKPFAYPELAARVRALLRRPPDSHGPTLQAGSIRLDPASRRVWCDEVLVPLTAKEFALLEYFLRRPGQVLSRSELIEHVWDANFDAMSNTVDVHVANLRRKLGAGTEAASIETLRGIGYQLRTDESESE